MSVEYSPGAPHDEEEIVGESPALRRALQQAKKIAPSDATVLILGEPGTGKKLLACAIHRMSPRRHANFAALDCAAIPPGLLQSKLFGHEKGALAGAHQRAIGGLELAQGGTLFLDHIEALPVELQTKLLRVLQHGEFENAGSDNIRRADIRLLASAHQDLAESVARGKFRADLYYRLSVFPIRMPALRQRVEDIPLLAIYFIQKYARRMNKNIDSVPDQALTALAGAEWPGNVGQLESLIEQAVIRCEGPVLGIPLAELEGGWAG